MDEEEVWYNLVIMKTTKPKFQITPKQGTTLKNWEKYRGSIVLTVDDAVYTTKSPKKVTEMIKEIEKKHHKKPLITVVPTEDTLILIELT